MKPYITTNDIALLSHALSVLSLLLQLAPEQTYPSVESVYLKDIYNIAHSPLLSGSSLDALLFFLARLVEADTEIATHVIPSLTIPLQKEKKGDASYANVAKCIGIIIRCHPSLAAGTIAEYSKALKVTYPSIHPTTRLLSCHPLNRSLERQPPLTLSWIYWSSGRLVVLCSSIVLETRFLMLTSLITSDFAQTKDLFATIIDLMGSSDEEVRSAASFAAGMCSAIRSLRRTYRFVREHYHRQRPALPAYHCQAHTEEQG